MRHIISFLTWRCGLNCPYCGYYLQPDGLSVKVRPSDKVSPVERELSAEEWVKLLKSLGPAHYDFCGGEPLRHPGFPKITHALDNWAVTSNTLKLIEEMGFNLPACVSWTASYHPHIPGRAKERFLRNLGYLKLNGVNVSVTLVAQPHTVDQILRLADWFQERGVRVNLHPFYDDRGFSWEDHPVEWEKLCRHPRTLYPELQKKWEGIKGEKECEGGRNYLCISPDGKLYRCLSALLLQWDKPLERPQEHKYKCSQPCYFPCDVIYGMGLQPPP